MQSRGVQIKLLELGYNQLSGTVPYIPGMQALDLHSNRLTDPRFDAIPTELRLLSLANNSFAGKLPQLHMSGTSLVGLKLLDLAYNQFSGSLPPDMPSNLSILNVSNNAFTGTLPSSWSRLQNMAELRLDNNQFTGRLPPSWAGWGNNTGNSIQLSITNTSLHGHMPRQWVQQFCLNIEQSGDARVLFKPVDGRVLETTGVWGPLIQLQAQHASINATLAHKTYNFDYNNPGSVCGIPHAVRNTGLLWGVFAALFLTTVTGAYFWQRRKFKPGPQRGCFSSHWKISTVLNHNRLQCSRQVANRVWFFISDVGWTIYSQVTDALTIHQVFSSRQAMYAYILLAILLLPFAVMFTLIVRVSIKRCQFKTGSVVVAALIGLLLSPILFIGLELALLLHGIGVPLPAWWSLLGVDLPSFYRTQSIAESFLNALPQSVVQSKLYLKGNDPNGVGLYIDTTLFVVSMIGSLFSVLKTVLLIMVEWPQSSCSFFAYCVKLIKFEAFEEYNGLVDSYAVTHAGSNACDTIQ